MMRQLTALMWKDWRLLRGAFLTMAVAGPLCMFPMAFVLGGSSRWRAELGFGALMCSFAVVIVLTAPAFASERKTGTLRFLFTTAAPRGLMFLSKAIVAGAASAVIIGAMVLIATLMGVTDISVHGEGNAMPWAPLLCWVIVLFGSAAASRVELVFALAAVAFVPVRLAPLLIYPFSVLNASPWKTIGYSPQALAVCRAGLQGAICLWVGWLAWRLFRRVGAVASPQNVATGAVKALLLLLVFFIAPAVAACGALWAREAWRPAGNISGVGDLVSLDGEGRWVAFTGEFPTLPFCAPAARACVLDTATGEATLLTRHTTSALHLYSNPLSPDGRRVAFQMSDVSAEYLDVVLPFLHRSRTPGVPSQLATYDLRTGTASMCLDDPPLIVDFVCWSGDAPFVLTFEAGLLVLRTVRDGKLMPPTPPPGDEEPAWTHWFTDGGEYLHRTIAGPPQRLELAVRAGDTWRTCTTRPLLRPQVIAKGGRWVLGVRGEPVAKVELLDARDGTPTLLWENRSNAFPGYRGGGFSKDGTVVWARMFPWT
ncbi:ABC transporter permease, partial [bacterium]|nr:ABC transporter permease [bacterium]